MTKVLVVENTGKSQRPSRKSSQKATKKATGKVIELKLKKVRSRKDSTESTKGKRPELRAVTKSSAAITKKAPKEAKKGSAATLSAEEAAAAAVPPYLVTPSAEILKSFRDAGKRSRDAARKLERMRTAKAQFLAKQPKSGKKYSIDLRIHSPATQGYFSTGGVEPTAAIVRLARVKGIDCIAVTDFYSVESIDEVRTAAQKTKIIVIPGFDLCCALAGCREVYLTALFSEEASTDDIRKVLEDIGVTGDVVGNRDHCLERDLGEVLEIIERAGGVVLPSRMDKTPYRQLAIPTLVEQFGFRAFDLVHPEHTEFFQERWPAGGFTFMSFSNANALAQIGSRVATVRLAAPGFQGIKELIARRIDAR